MRNHRNAAGTILVLERGEELIASLTKYAKESNLDGAWLGSGLGGAGSVTLSFYDVEKREYIDKVFDKPLEILSLQGNLAWADGEPFWHVHGVFGDDMYTSIGGHVKSLEIALTGELFILPLETPMARIYDEATGLKLFH